MRVIVINAKEQTIGEAEVPDSQGLDMLKAVYELIGGGCDIVERLPIPHDNIFVDEEGLYRQSFYWHHKRYPMPIAGSAVVFGRRNDGDNITGSTETVEEVRDQVTFMGQGGRIDR